MASISSSSLGHIVSQLRKRYSNLVTCTRTIPPPDSSHVILANPRSYSRKYHHFDSVRKSRIFALRDTSTASLLRMYELLLCGLEEELALETEYFWNRKWKIAKIPDPTNYGWEKDLERDRICQALVLILVDSFNYRVAVDGFERSMDKIPKWGLSLFDHIDGPEELHQLYPGLGKLFFGLPWKHLSCIHPPCSHRIIINYSAYFANIYKHYLRTMSLPLFTSNDTQLSSLCRIYELSIIQTCGAKDFYSKEMTYFFEEAEWKGMGVRHIPDPRQRWVHMDIREPDVFGRLVELVKSLARVEKEVYKGSGIAPPWARNISQCRNELIL
jgi:hypothetical protein